MYVYDTREKNCKSLPLYGWLFPCIICLKITSSFKNDKLKRGFFDLYSKTVYVPICNICIKNNDVYILDPILIKKIN